MKDSKLGGRLRATFVVILVGSAAINYYVHDRDLRWAFLVIEALLLGVLIGVSGYDWMLRKSK
jgi:hypothetical protein